MLRYVGFQFDAVSVRPIGADERVRFDATLDKHHWLGRRLVGETMRYVALGVEGECVVGGARVWRGCAGFWAAGAFHRLVG